MKTKLALLGMFLSAAAFGQCGSAGHLIINPLTGLWDCTANLGVPPSGTAGGDLTGTYPDPLLVNVTTAGGCGDTTHSCSITVDAKGRTITYSDNVITTTGTSVGVPPYSTTTITSSPMTILAATHGQGIYAFAVCWDTSTPRQEMVCNDTRNAAGDLVFTYTVAPGEIDIFGSTGGSTVDPTPGYSPNQILSGCGVEYVSLLTFNVGACVYTINGLTYSSAMTSKTLTAADATNPRIDVIGVDNTGVVFVTDGIAASSPQQPTLDPTTQLGLTFVYVAAMATTPTGPSVTEIYEENIEWTCTPSANLDCASTSNPFRGTKDIEATTAVITNSVTLVKPTAGTTDLSTVNTLMFYIRSKAAWPVGSGGATAARSLSISWLNGSTQIGVPVVLRDGVFGFSSSVTSAYQQVAIPIALFGAGANLVTSLKITVAGITGSSTIGFYLDAITLQAGNGTIPFPSTTMNFQGTWSALASYVPNDTVVSAGVGYVALTANTNVAVSTAATWAKLATITGGTCTNQFVTVISSTGVPTCTTATLASTQFANQGTTTTVLHGNASGNPSFTQIVNADITNSTIDLTAKVTGILPSGNSQPHSIGFVIDGGGSAITTGDKGIYPTVDFACTINRIDISADQSGSITVDVWKAAGAIPTSGNKISASAPLTLSSAQLAQNGSRTGWTTSVSVGDVFGFSVASATTVTRVVGQVWCQ